MKENHLYLMCPDCHIEVALNNQFCHDITSFTALGSIFDFSDLGLARELDNFIDLEKISHIIIVNDPDCTFIKNTITNPDKGKTVADVELKRLQTNNHEKFALLDTSSQQELLAKLNIYRQAFELLEVPSIGDKINHGQIAVSGLLYDRITKTFKVVAMEW